MMKPEDAYKKNIIPSVRNSMDDIRASNKREVSHVMGEKKGGWMETAKDSIKLKTTEKWKMMKKRRGANKLMAENENRISDIEGKIDDVNSEFGSRMEELEANQKTADDYLNEPKNNDPLLRKSYENTKLKQADRIKEAELSNKQRLEDLNAEKVKLEDARTGYESRIKGIEDVMIGKIDGKISKIQGPEYNDRIRNRDILEKQIGGFQKSIKEAEGKAQEYRRHLNKGVFQGEEKTNVENVVGELERKIKRDREKLENRQKDKEKIDRQIAKVDKKTLKWRNLKGQYGLERPEETKEDLGKAATPEKANIMGGGGGSSGYNTIDYLGGAENEEGKEGPNGYNAIDYSGGAEKAKTEAKTEVAPGKAAEEAVSEKKEGMEDIREKIDKLIAIESICRYNNVSGWDTTKLSGVNDVETLFIRIQKMSKEPGLADVALKKIKFMNKNDNENIGKTMGEIWSMAESQRKILEQL